MVKTSLMPLTRCSGWYTEGYQFKRMVIERQVYSNCFRILLDASEQKKLLKHSQTLWLSMHRCLTSLHCKELCLSYMEAERTRSKIENIHSTLEDPATLSWVHFVCHVLIKYIVREK